VRRAAESAVVLLLEIGPSLAPGPAPALLGYDDLLDGSLEAEEAGEEVAI